MSLRRTQLIQGPPGPGTAKSDPTAWTPGTIASGAFVALTLACAGAVVGLPALAAWSAVLPDGVVLSAQASSAGHVRAQILNLSGNPVTITAGFVFVEAFTS